MLNTAQPILFIATDNADASRQFYENALGLAFVADEPFALVFKSGGCLLRIAKVEQVQAAPYTVQGWEVPDIGSTMTQLAANGVVFERYGHTDEHGVWQTPDGARIAWFKDPVGNLLSLTQVP